MQLQTAANERRPALWRAGRCRLSSLKGREATHHELPLRPRSVERATVGRACLDLPFGRVAQPREARLAVVPLRHAGTHFAGCQACAKKTPSGAGEYDDRVTRAFGMMRRLSCSPRKHMLLLRLSRDKCGR